MKEFMDIMQLMNNGLYNNSTLKDIIPKISALTMKQNPRNIGRVMNWMIGEECLSNPHPGLNETIQACKTVIATELQNKINEEKEVVASPTR